MTSAPPLRAVAIDLYALLPAIHRRLDAQRGLPLKALLDVISEQANLLKLDIDRLWDDLFIETASEWVIPYIGDLVGSRPLPHAGLSRRADVAKTLYYRRRKGTLPLLEELARDVTGWGTHAEAFFEHLLWTQNDDHVRLQPAPATSPHRHDPRAWTRVGTAHVRDADAMNRIDGPFDSTAHAVDARPPGRRTGWHNIPHVGIFTWPLKSHPLTDVWPRRARRGGRCKDDGPHFGFHVDPLRPHAPLFINPLPETDEAARSTELHVPGPIRPLALERDLEACRVRFLDDVAKGRWDGGEPYYETDHYGVGKSLLIRRFDAATKSHQPISAHAVIVRDLSDWTPPPHAIVHRDRRGRPVGDPIEVGVAVDPARGRIAFPPGREPARGEVTATFHYGSAAFLGGGPYPRSTTDPDRTWFRTVDRHDPKADHVHLKAAIDEWNASDRPDGIIRIQDNLIHGGHLAVEVPRDGSLVIEADHGVRPHIRLVGPLRVEGHPEGSAFRLSGLAVEGSLQLAGRLDTRLDDCTLVPGHRLDDEGQPRFPDLDSVTVDEASRLDIRLTLRRTIVGPLRLPAQRARLEASSSIVHAHAAGGVQRPAIAANDAGDEPGPPTTLDRCTVLGPVHVKRIDASQCIFTHAVTAQRRQAGCIRFSHVPDGSLTPRRYACQPDLVLESTTGPARRATLRLRVRPTFVSTRYGHPEYLRLRPDAPAEIRAGGEKGTEMGVHNLVLHTRRLSNLDMRMEEYLPVRLRHANIPTTIPEAEP